MNINKLISRIKDDLGLKKFLKLNYSDKEIYDILRRHAFEEWSHYFKFQIMFRDVQMTPEDKIETSLYNIPYEVMAPILRSGLEIIDVRARVNSNLYGNTTYGSYMSMYSDFMDLDSAYTGNVTTRQIGGMDMFMNYLHASYYEKPNRIRFNYDTGINGQDMSYEFRVFVSQPANMLAISETREHDFYELCKLNVMIVLYNNEAKYIESISSGLGNINLKLDDWASAASKKEELLKVLQGYSTLEQSASIVM